MSKYKEENIIIKNRPQGWTKNNPFGTVKFYRKNNWIISYGSFGIDYWIIDESYVTDYYITRNKQRFLEERHKLAYKNTLVWKALHGEYDDE